MALNAATVEYATKDIYGDETYDAGGLNWGTAIPGREGFPERERTAPTIRHRRKSAARKQEADARSVSAFMIVSMIIVAVLVVLILMAHVHLTALSSQTAVLESQISQLKEDESELLVQYENAFNLTEVERYATKELGMVKLSNNQTTTIYVTTADKAVVLNEKVGVFNALTESIKMAVTSFSEYFS
ncbi:MAG: hypothetical protein IJG63_04350 [Oscillospiraceae bacterium]|nr:hypothetical protein [Oscillospiraceae bacterium]